MFSLSSVVLFYVAGLMILLLDDIGESSPRQQRYSAVN